MDERQENEPPVQAAADTGQAQTRSVDVGKLTLPDTLILIGKDYQDAWNASFPAKPIGLNEVVAAHVAALAWLLAIDKNEERTAENIVQISLILPAAVVAEKKRQFAHAKPMGSA